MKSCLTNCHSDYFVLLLKRLNRGVNAFLILTPTTCTSHVQATAKCAEKSTQSQDPGRQKESGVCVCACEGGWWMGRLKTRDWKTRYHLTGVVENARLENAGPSYRWVENARPVAMERQWYQFRKTEMDVVLLCRKITRTCNILYAVINSYRKTYTLLTQSELKSLRKIRMHQKSAKNTPFVLTRWSNMFAHAYT